MKEHRVIGIAAIALLAYLAVGVAKATTLTVAWQNPVENTDNSAIPASGTGSLTSALVEWGSCNGTAFGTKAGEKSVPRSGAMPTSTQVDLNPGTYCFRVSVTNTFGTASDFSAVVSKTVTTKPGAPSGVTVTLSATSPTAYTLIKQRDSLVMLPVGTIPVGTECIQDQNANGYFAVPRASVTFSGSVKPEIVFGQCG